MGFRIANLNFRFIEIIIESKLHFQENGEAHSLPILTAGFFAPLILLKLYIYMSFPLMARKTQPMDRVFHLYLKLRNRGSRSF